MMPFRDGVMPSGPAETLGSGQRPVATKTLPAEISAGRGTSSRMGGSGS